MTRMLLPKHTVKYVSKCSTSVEAQLVRSRVLKRARHLQSEVLVGKYHGYQLALLAAILSRTAATNSECSRSG